MIFIKSISNLDGHNLKFFNLITHWVCGALPLGKYFTESKISKTVIIKKKSRYARSVPRARAIVPGNM